jgi:hypothetical protein
MTLSIGTQPEPDTRDTPLAPSANTLPTHLVGVLSMLTLLMLMIWLTRRAARPLHNPDTWFHLRIGREFWGDWSITDPGSLSSFATASWVPTQWSTQMLAAAMESRFGLPGVAWLFGALSLALVVAVYLVCRSQGGTLPAALATGVVMIAAMPSLSARPQVVSLILFVVLVGAWLRAADGGRPPWLLIPMTWFWATAHGLWTAGVLFGLVVCVGLILDRRIAMRKAASFLAVPVGSLMAACLTPVGPGLLTSQLVVGQRAPLIGEWGPTSFREFPALLAAIFVATVILLWCRRNRVEWTPLLMLLLAGAWILTVIRMVPFGVIAVAPMFVRAFTDLIDRRHRPRRPSALESVALGGGFAVCLVALALAVPQSAQEPANVPNRFEPALSQLPAGSTVLVEDPTGAWIEWRFPDLSPVIDGMFDAYTVAHMEEYKAFRNVEPGWTGFVGRSNASIAVLLDGSPLSAAMQSQLEWEVVQRDQDWVMLIAPS